MQHLKRFFVGMCVLMGGAIGNRAYYWLKPWIMAHEMAIVLTLFLIFIIGLAYFTGWFLISQWQEQKGRRQLSKYLKENYDETGPKS